MSRLTQSIYICCGLPLFLRPGGVISIVFLRTQSWSRLFTWPNNSSLVFLHISVVFSTFILSLMLSFLTWSLSVWPPVHLHMFIPVTTRCFTCELVTGTVCIPYSIAFCFSMMISLLADSFSEMRLAIIGYTSLACV